MNAVLALLQAVVLNEMRLSLNNTLLLYNRIPVELLKPVRLYLLCNF